MSRAVLALAALMLAGCAGKPKVPDWQIEAHGALQRYEQAFLSGAERAAAADFARARSQLSATGSAALVARAELTRCALQVASLDFKPCEGFEPLRPDAPAAERAYAAYLAGRPVAADVALLPPQHRGVAALLAADASAVAIAGASVAQGLAPGRAQAQAAGQAQAQALRAIGDPLARLIAAGVLSRAGRASPSVLALAVEEASRQGWRRPLLAWLQAQAQRAEQAGADDEAQRLRRRIALVAGER